MRKLFAGILTLLMVLPAYAFDLPQGATILTSPEQISSYKILGQVGKSGEKGSYLFGIPKTTQTLGAIHFVQAQSFTLAGAGSSVGATTLTLRSFNNVDGTPLNMSDFGEKGFGTIEPNNGTQQEQISFTSTTRNSNGTVTLRGVSTVLNVYPYTETLGLATTHPGGVLFVLSNTVGLYNTLANKYNNEVVSGTWSFATYPRVTSSVSVATSPNQFVTLYQLSIASTTGCVNANTSVRGCVQEATDAMLQTSSSTGSTGARTYANGGSFAQTSTANKVPVSNGQGIIDGSWINTSTSMKNIATTTPTAGFLPLADASGTLNSWITLNNQFPFTPNTLTDNTYFTYTVVMIPSSTDGDPFAPGTGWENMWPGVGGTQERTMKFSAVASTTFAGTESLTTLLMGTSSRYYGYGDTRITRIKWRMIVDKMTSPQQIQIGVASSSFADNNNFAFATPSTSAIYDANHAGGRMVFAITGTGVTNIPQLSVVVSNNISVSAVPISGINTSVWNTYEIIFTNTNAQFWINGTLQISTTTPLMTRPFDNAAFGFGNSTGIDSMSITDPIVTQQL